MQTARGVSAEDLREGVLKQAKAEQANRKKRLLVICQGSLETVATLTRVLNQIKLLRNCEVIQLHVVWLLDWSYRSDPARKQWVESIRREWTFPHIVLYGLPLRHLGALGRLISAGLRMTGLVGYIVGRRIEIVQAHSMGGVHGVLLRLGKFFGFRALLDMQGAYPEEMAYKGESAATVRRLDVQERTLLQACDSILCVSSNMVEHVVRKHNVAPTKFQIVPCCVSKSLVGAHLERRQQMRRFLGLEDKFVVVYSGGTASYQCIPEMCALFADIAQRWPEAVWLVLSWGNFGLFRRCVASYGVDDSRCHFKQLEQNEVHDYLVAGDVGLLLREDHLLNRVSSPTKFAEYLAAGLPVIATPYVGDVASAVVRDGVGITVELPPATDIEALMLFLARVRDHREQLARQCLACGERDWVWESRETEFLRAIGVEE